MRSPSPSQAFRKFVCDPIPKSVKEIRMDRHVELLGLIGKHRYVFYFRIDEVDLLPILNSRPFQAVQYIKYNDESGMLTWAREPPDLDSNNFYQNTYGLSLTLYSLASGERVPEWFSLGQWDSPKVYLFWERNVIRVRLLVYNKELGEAYFIDERAPD